MPYIDLYVMTALLVGLLLGACLGFFMARQVTSTTTARLERKVQSLSDRKFRLQGQRARLKQLEQRLDDEAAKIPEAEEELKQKSREIKELTVALTETTTLTNDLGRALRARKAKLEQLEAERGKWEQRNKALRLKTEQLDDAIERSEEALDDESDPKAGSPARANRHGGKRSKGKRPARSGKASKTNQTKRELRDWFEGRSEEGSDEVSSTQGLSRLQRVLRGDGPTKR
ncbi:MAG: hypothetical protein AAF515_11835 [Pseudomonadota bacterium]